MFRSLPRFLAFYTVFALQLCLSFAASAQGRVIYQDDFESGVSGWSVNTTDFDPDTTTFLGPFDVNSQSTSRSFVVPAGSESLIIEFDFLRFDSWDNFAQFGFDRFEFEIDGSQIFSLPFPNPQAARSGVVGNAEWSHTPTTGRVELAYQTGQYWFDQIHRFEITVNNPGSTVDLTLRSAVSQAFNDESGAYDNFLVTAFPPPGTEITAVAENFPTIDGTAGGMTTSVLSSDTYDNQPATPSDVTLSVLSTSSPNVALDPLTGLITVNPGTPAGFYTVEYQICEVTEPTNCASVEETVGVNNSVPGGSGGFCPIGSVGIPGTYHTVSATGGNNANRTVGAPLDEGTIETGNNSGTTYYQDITMDLTGDPTILVPEGEVIDIVLSSAWGNNALAEISMSADDATYTSLGTTGNGGSVYGAWTSNTLRYDKFTVPAGGIRYVRVFRQNGGVRVDGVIYSTQCHPNSSSIDILSEDDSVTVTSVTAVQSAVLNVVDNDTSDGSQPTSFDLALASGSSLPNELTFDLNTGDVGVVAGTPAGVYSFDYEICDPQDSNNCSTSTVTITVELALIEANPESFPSVNGASGGTTTSILASDLLNNGSVNAADVTVTVGTSAPELTLNPATGFITVAANTAGGTYTVEYTICENINPANCSTAVETIDVPPTIADISILKTNSFGVNGNIDQTNDTLVSGATTTYVLVVTNNGPDSITGAMVNDTVGAGLTCLSETSVDINGNGVPSGTFTLADLTGAGISLETLADGQSTTLSYSCTVN